MPAEASNLIQLIRKLKQGEKRFITLELSRYRKETDLLKLYNLINNNPGITDADIRKKIKNQKKADQLSINKHTLHTKILESLQLFHFKTSPRHQVSSLIHQAYILDSKGLSKAKADLLSKAEKIAERYELRELQLEIINLQQKGKRNDSVKLIRKTEEISKIFLTERKLNQLLNQSIVLENQPGNHLKNNDHLLHKKIMMEAMGLKGDSFHAMYYRYRTCFTYYAIFLDHKQTYLWAQKIIQLFQAHSHMLELDAWRTEYIESLGNFIPCYIHFKKNDQLDFIYRAIDRLDAPELYKASITINVLDAYIQTGAYRDSEKKVMEVQKNIDFYRENISVHNHAILYFNLGVLNFGMNKFSKALFWFNEIINGSYKHKRSISVTHMTRILRILVFFEMGNTDIIENQLRSTTRHIAKHGPQLAFDRPY